MKNKIQKSFMLMVFTSMFLMFANPDVIADNKGTTWEKRATEDIGGTVHVSCAGCNPYQGDTMCTVELPVLCINDLNLAKPTFVDEPSRYHRWSGGVVATTPPVAPAQNGLTTIQKANTFCANHFGPRWRVAEHHDGWGWNFKAYGNVGNPDQRFWIDINDQRNGNCWTR